MKRGMMKKLFIFLVVLLASPFAYANNASPAGLWEAFDDDGKATGFIRIIENQGIFTGLIEKGLPEDKEDKYCTECKDERKNQKLVGMTIIKNVKAKDEKYVGDEILDPFTGKTYRVQIKLKEAGKKLEVHGFIGISLFGRTQIWERANE